MLWLIRYIGRKKCGIFGVLWVAILGHIFSIVLDFASINKKLSFSDILGEYIFGVGLAINNLEFRNSPLVGPVTAGLGCKKNLCQN